MEAKYYSKLEDSSVECRLCPHQCKIRPGKTGLCGTRTNRNGALELDHWGVIASSGLDPIEKKPLYHFHPGSTIYSIGGYGCNLKCSFCQNCDISQYIPNIPGNFRRISPAEIVARAKSHPSNIGIAYTYNEPTILFEYMLETAHLAKEQGLKNVMVSNGFINPKPLDDLLNVIDAFNIDLKAFSDEFYKNLTRSRLQPVLDTLKIISSSGNHLEVTLLVIPGYNDNPLEAEEMFSWMSSELGNSTVLHLSRYHPAYKLNAPPTPPETMTNLYNLAKSYLHYVYFGNMPFNSTGHNTYCPNCTRLLIERMGYRTNASGVNANGDCMYCEHKVLGGVR